VAELDPATLGGREVAGRVEIEEPHLLEVERNGARRLGEPRLQDLHVGRGDPPDEHESRSGVSGDVFDFQHHARSKGNRGAMIKPLIQNDLDDRTVAKTRQMASFDIVTSPGRGAPGFRQVVRKRCLSICRDRIFDSRVDLGIPSLAAAPSGPATRPRD